MTNAPSPSSDDLSARVAMGRKTRRAFTVGGLSALAGVGGLAWLATRPNADGIPWPLRWALGVNEGVGRALFSDAHLAPEFDRGDAGEPRVNGRIGWTEQQPTATDWRLRIEFPNRPERAFALSEFARVPRTDEVTELKCVEGWSQIVHWGGWRFKDVLQAFDLLPGAGSPLQYLHLSTPNGGYTVGLDLPSALHPQTLLCDSMNGKPLTEGHGAPIRMILPVKYGIKNIKWLSRIRFQASRPTDYWTERGYDWYAGL